MHRVFVTIHFSNAMSCLAAVLSADGSRLWTATEGGAAGSIALTCYAPHSSPAVASQWRLLRSYAGPVGLPHDAASSPLTMHLLPAAEALALVTRGGLVVLVSIPEPNATPQVIQLVRFLPTSQTATALLAPVSLSCVRS